MRIICLSTPVGPLGSGLGGGVELTLRTLVRGLSTLGHTVTVVAPVDSHVAPTTTIERVGGALHVPSQTLDRSTPPVVPDDSVLVNMWRRVTEMSRSGNFDIVLNFAYDALPFVASRECAIPVAHLVSMGSLSDEMDRAVAMAVDRSSRCVAMHSHAQARSFGPEIAGRVTVVASGIDLSAYDYIEAPDTSLAFVARISREKGVRDAFAVATLTGRVLNAFGVMEDRSVWDDAAREFPNATVEYRGFLTTDVLQRELGRSAALIMVHHWVEAFGNVAIEALACGVPVITYDRGGPAEIVHHGRTGFVVPPDDVSAVAGAVDRLGTIQRRDCRSDVEDRYSEQAFAGRVAAWLAAVGR